jgi:hypothetical protein
LLYSYLLRKNLIKNIVGITVNTKKEKLTAEPISKKVLNTSNTFTPIQIIDLTYDLIQRGKGL